MRIGKIIGLGLAAAFIAIQFVRSAKNAAPAGRGDLLVMYPPPPDVQRLLATACYDCHSNQTRYPWYAQVQPVGWWLARHIDEAKGELNLSEFGDYTEHRRAQKLLAISDEVNGHTMPLKSYTWIHREAKLTPAQIKTLGDWAEALADKIEPQE